MITSRNNIDDVIATVVHILESTLDYDRGLILLANIATQRLEIRGAFGYSDEHLDLLESTSFRIDNPSSQGPFVVSFREKKPLLVNDTSEIYVTSKSRQFIEALGTKSFLAVPIILENESIGILAVDNQQRAQAAVELRNAGRLSDEDARRLRWLDAFGALIGNSDRHQFNVLVFPDGTRFRLAPAFDQVSMLYAPSGDGRVPVGTLVPPRAGSDTLDVWDDARAAARDFWVRASDDGRVSDELRSVCSANARAPLRG